MQAEEYILLDKVYGNYISFQERIIPILKTYKSTSKINVLEIGCGTGITTEILLKTRENIKLTTIDLDSEVIEYARQNLSSYSNVSFLVADALSFVKEQKSNSYDLIISAFTIHNLTNEYREHLYKEIFRILKPNGLFINADKFVSDNEEEQIAGLKYRIGTYIDTLARENKLDLLKEWTTHYIDDHHPDKLLQFDKTLADLAAVGFKNSEYLFKSDKEMLGFLKTEK
ncbi:MAG TPA: class I SAM-dependent methyltransferase [Chitinophagales bacterium]|nr:class I SAM-dependent methyltransferase [Chitinophagales bacterium]HMY41855.1 class I SAM-dependent methyltransferase [Chitinophagales bacterium]HNB39496.1 class I SAM-dependent methyltransferase [Chitinophagales bacterium]HNJ02428.1 class I SAM-dependent methyltransferase [Chitinophagales bacterium]HNN27056.1 class I SAM-dependent methyltransferase [Chitinophagales bacterium]